MIKKSFFKNILILAVIGFVACFPVFGLAQNTGVGGPPSSSTEPGGSVNVKIKNPIGVDNLNDFIKKVLEAVIRIGLPIVAIALIYSGYLFIEAQGNSGKLETAKRAFVYTLLGAAILLGAWALAQAITETVIQISK